jgi:predicted membrane protein
VTTIVGTLVIGLTVYMWTVHNLDGWKQENEDQLTVLRILLSLVIGFVVTTVLVQSGLWS